MMRRAGLGILLSMTAACSSTTVVPAPSGSEWTSGSRLRAQIEDGGDGAAIFVGWRDTQLGAWCNFDFHADGSLRCLPQPGGLFYLDAGCTEKAIEIGSCYD